MRSIFMSRCYVRENFGISHWRPPDIRGRSFTVRSWQSHKAGLGRLREAVIMGCLSQERLKGPPSRGGAAWAVFEEVTLETAWAPTRTARPSSSPSSAAPLRTFPSTGGPSCHSAHSRSVQVLVGRGFGKGGWEGSGLCGITAISAPSSTKPEKVIPSLAFKG